MAPARGTTPAAVQSGKLTELDDESGAARALGNRIDALSHRIDGLHAFNQSLGDKIDRLVTVVGAVDALKTDVADLKRDTRTDADRLLNRGLAAVAFLLVAFGVAFVWLELRITGATDSLGGHIGKLETDAASTNARLDDLLARIPPIPTPVNR